jgi:hypothetical protein
LKTKKIWKIKTAEIKRLLSKKSMLKFEKKEFSNLNGEIKKLEKTSQNFLIKKVPYLSKVNIKIK